jgi:hypothetical protein
MLLTSHFLSHLAFESVALILAAMFLAVFAGPIVYGLWRGRRAPMLTSANATMGLSSGRLAAYFVCAVGVLQCALVAAQEGWSEAGAAAGAWIALSGILGAGVLAIKKWRRSRTPPAGPPP